MGKFVAIHPFSSPVKLEEVAPVAKVVKAKLRISLRTPWVIVLAPGVGFQHQFTSTYNGTRGSGGI